jgi:hypothetical protein
MEKGAASEDRAANQNDPKFWRARAQEARFQADRINDPESKRAMLSIADTYDRMAKRVEARNRARRLSIQLIRDIAQIVGDLRSAIGHAAKLSGRVAYETGIVSGGWHGFTSIRDTYNQPEEQPT